MTIYKDIILKTDTTSYLPKKGRKDTFFILTPETRDKLLNANLTAAEWRVWSYLVSLDPSFQELAPRMPLFLNRNSRSLLN